jgi:hypothetical protein
MEGVLFYFCFAPSDVQKQIPEPICTALHDQQGEGTLILEASVVGTW